VRRWGCIGRRRRRRCTRRRRIGWWIKRNAGAEPQNALEFRVAWKLFASGSAIRTVVANSATIFFCSRPAVFAHAVPDSWYIHVASVDKNLSKTTVGASSFLCFERILIVKGRYAQIFIAVVYPAIRFKRRVIVEV